MAAAKQRQQQSSGSNTGSWKTFGAGGIKWKPQQIAVALLIYPKSPMKRLLVDHNTGSGKTLVMLAIMENYYFDRSVLLERYGVRSAQAATTKMIVSHRLEFLD